MSPADAARRSLEELIAAHRSGDRQAQVDTRRRLKVAVRDVARASHAGQLTSGALDAELFGDPAASRAAIAALTALSLGSRTSDPALLREYARILEEELLTDPRPAVVALLGIASLLMGESLAPVAYVLGLREVSS